MNLLTIARLASNIALVLGAILLFSFVLLGRELNAAYLIAFGALALAGGVLQFIVSLFRPKSIRPAWDEQTVASHRGSYQFGYWATLVGFWCLFALGVPEAFLIIGIILICAPSAWMAVATLIGRAG